ncbi:MAG: T9SS type A sorting domain-containing protein, partial [Candidatus Kapabacteria bacterium]|nr:T9SS type A sorting domain-containing protein [Candidatus Kapabacteria bacterium]
QGYSTMTEGAVKYTIEFDNQAPTAIASQQQSPITAVGMENGSIYFYNTRTGQLIGEVSFPYPVQCLSWNANGTQLLVGGTGGAVAKYTIGTTSSVENETIDALSVHPNPVNDMLMIHDSEITESTRYTVRNILGQIIQSGSFERGMAISTASWSSGTYYVSAGKKHAVIVKQ